MSTPSRRGWPPRTVLVAEDDDQIRPLVAQSAGTVGCRVVCASRGDDALAAAERFDGPIDLLLSDVVMPGLDGVELAGRLREARPTVSVLFMSGYASDLLVHKGVGRSQAGFVAPPFHLNAFVPRSRRPSRCRRGARRPTAADRAPGAARRFVGQLLLVTVAPARAPGVAAAINRHSPTTGRDASHADGRCRRRTWILGARRREGGRRSAPAREVSVNDDSEGLWSWT